jgi:hypothetical protein
MVVPDGVWLWTTTTTTGGGVSQDSVGFGRVLAYDGMSPYRRSVTSTQQFFYGYRTPVAC